MEVAIDEALAQAFGRDTDDYNLYAAAATIDQAGHYVGHETPLYEVVEGLRSGKDRAIALLQQAIRSFKERLADLTGEVLPPVPPRPAVPDSSDIFVVHGHDSPAKVEVALLIERAGLHPVILHEKPNSGRTIIEKFEAHGGSAGFAVILLTPDDVGAPAAREVRALRPRARQNVIGEMFWFAAKLGRSRVCALKKGEIEVPSDFVGVIYTEMDDRGAWKSELLREFEAAGYKVNWSKAMV